MLEVQVIELTDSQVLSLAAEGVPTLLVNPRTQEAFVLLRDADYRRLTAADYDDTPWTREEMAALAWNAGRQIGWDKMSEYDELPEKS